MAVEAVGNVRRFRSQWLSLTTAGALSVCAINQFLTRVAMANPGNGLKALGIDLLLAVEALAECALADPFQCGIQSEQKLVTRFLTNVYFSRQRHVRAIALVLAVIVLCSPRFLVGLGEAQPELAVANL
jgi:hypothetical protein